MPVYEVRGLDAAGKAVTHVVDAENERVARMRLRRDGIFATAIKTKAGGGTKEANTSKGGLSREVDLKHYFQRISSGDIAALTRQLATLLGAGIPLIQTLAAVNEQTDNEKLKVILAAIKEDVSEGAGLGDALQNHPKVFSNLYVNMVRAGEQSGAIEHVLDQLADHTEKQNEMQSEVLGALFYPAVLGGISMLIISFLMVFVVPKISKIFGDYDVALPLLTQVVIGISWVLGHFWWLLILAFAFGVWAFRRWLTTVAGRKRFDAWSLNVMVAGRLVKLSAMSRFASTLATLLGAGVPLLRALDIVAAVLGNVVLEQTIQDARENISEGQSIARPLRASGHFPPLLLSMIETGERTGDLEPMLQRVAITYEKDVHRAVKTFTSLIEPLMIVVLGGVSLVITLSIMMPMLRLSSIAS